MYTNKECSALTALGNKLGLENTVIMKAEEYYRLCFAKSNLDKIGDLPRAVLCLDLSAKSTGAAFNKTTALRLSTLSSVVYQKYHNLIETSLGLKEILTIPKLCVKLNCSEAQDFAETILSKYKAQNIMVDDLHHPQYNTIAVYTACKLKGIKTAKIQFRQESRLQTPQWKRLENKFLKFVKQVGLDVELKRSNKTTNDKVKEITQTIESNENVKEERVSEEIEDYEIWKARIIKEAKEALKIVK